MYCLCVWGWVSFCCMILAFVVYLESFVHKNIYYFVVQWKYVNAFLQCMQRVIYMFTAGHLPQKQHDYRRKYRTLASTYVTFGPDGNELLVNLGGEQIYLFDVNRRQLPRRFDVSIRQKISPAVQPEFKGCLPPALLLFLL